MQVRSKAPHHEPLPYLRHRHTRLFPVWLAFGKFLHWLTERPATKRILVRPLRNPGAAPRRN